MSSKSGVPQIRWTGSQCNGRRGATASTASASTAQLSHLSAFGTEAARVREQFGAAVWARLASRDLDSNKTLPDGFNWRLSIWSGEIDGTFLDEKSNTLLLKKPTRSDRCPRPRRPAKAWLSSAQPQRVGPLKAPPTHSAPVSCDAARGNSRPPHLAQRANLG